MGQKDIYNACVSEAGGSKSYLMANSDPTSELNALSH